MKYRCPYCKHVFGPEPSALCPACGKGMRFPGSGRKVPATPPAGAGGRQRAVPDENPILLLFKSGAGRALAMLVVAVLGVAGVLVMSRSEGIRPPVLVKREDRAQREVNSLRAALELFRGDVGRYPTAEEGLLALINRPAGVTNWTWHYVKLIRPDPWRHPYVYVTDTNTSVWITSAGADGIPGTPDDISPSSWEASYQQAVTGRAAAAAAEKAAEAESNDSASR